MIDTAANVEGVVRNAGTHAAGVIIADQPIINYVPLHRPTGSAAAESPIKIVTQFEMNILDSLGLLKVDFLGLATLTIMAKACDLIQQRHGIRYTLGNIPTDDPATYELLGRGETAGVFQVEGSGMRRWLMEMKPSELKHVVAMVALFRPGPMDFIPAYIRRMHGEEEIEYRHPLMEEIFKETYGYPVYQEQLMFAVMKLAGYTAPEADDLRKAIAKKMPEKLTLHRQKFIEGAKNNGISDETAEAIFTDWEEFARYGFNKSHAVDYAVIAVQTAYLKLHYPVEYFTALLSVSKSDNAKVALYTVDARRMGVAVEPPEINASEWDFAIEDCAEGASVIRFGLGAVKNVGQGAVEIILAERKNGRFADINDFARRVDLRQVGRRVLECLTKVGAMEGFGHRIALLDSLDRIIAISASHFRAVEAGQMSLFGMSSGVSENIPIPTVRSEINKREILGWEKELIGLYVSDHPLNSVIEELESVVTHFSGQLAEAAHLEHVRVSGIIARMRSHVTKSGEPMAFVSLEDLQGTIELVIFPRTWERVSELVQIEKIVIVDGKVDAASGDPKILVDNITTNFTRTVGYTPLQSASEKKPGRKSSLLTGTASAAKPSQVPVTDSDQDLTQIRPELTVEDLGFTASQDESSEFEAGAQDGRRSLQDIPPAKSSKDEWADTPPPAAQSRKNDRAITPPPPAKSGKDEWADTPPPPDDPPDWLELPKGQAAGNNVSPQATDLSGQDSIKGLVGLTENGLQQEDARAGIAEPGIYERTPAMALSAIDSLPQETIDRPSRVEKRLGLEEATLPAMINPAPETLPKPPVVIAPQRKSSSSENHTGSNNLPSYLISPLQELDDYGEVRMLTVTLRATGDKTRDVLRMRRLHGVIITYPGNDRFAVQIYERGKRYLLEFPNSTTHVCQELLDRLYVLVGNDNIRIEPIRFQ